MKINYADFLQITDSIRNKLYEYSFPPVERDIIMNALGLYGARIPGKLEPAKQVQEISPDKNRCLRCDGDYAHQHNASCHRKW